MGRDFVCCCCLLFCVLLTCLVDDTLAIRTKKVQHLKEVKFSDNEYMDPDPEIEERESDADYPMPPLEQQLRKRVNLSYVTPTSSLDKLSSNIKWDTRWASSVDGFGQISAVSIDPRGNIAVFHRGERIWDASTFGRNNKFNINRGPIRENTIVLLDRNGRVKLKWGGNMFYLPHGLTVDSHGNYWITDVAMHQVFKFDGETIEKHREQLSKQKFYNQRTNIDQKVDVNNLFAHSLIKPSLMLGEAFQPGNDNLRFCKPTAVAISKNGDFFVSDGYCNSRVIKFNKNGERIMQWGRTWGFEGKAVYNQPAPPNAFLVPHALALAEEHNYIFIADRENARIVCSFASNGTFYREYKNPIFGEAIYSIAYAKDHIYLVNGNRYFENVHVRGFVLDINTGKVLTEFAPTSDMQNPHDIAVSRDESEIYVVELNSRKIYKFKQDIHSADVSVNIKKSEPKKLSHRAIAIVAIIIALLFIGFCIFLAALFARYQKRGCLFPPHKRHSEWNGNRTNNFKLSSLLETPNRFNFFEGRPNSRDFSKLNTEPETSEDENPEISLEKII